MNGANHAALLNRHSIPRTAKLESEIVSAAQAGSPGAFTELYATYSRRLYRTIVAITKNPEDAEDALQDTFLRVCLAIHTFEGRASIYSWLTRIAVNSALMILRKRRTRAEILFDPQPDDPAETFCLEIRDPEQNPEQACDAHQRRKRLQRAIYSLDSHLREPIRMQVEKDASLKEIGRVLNLSEAAVKTRLHRARLRISAACRKP
jgi:RNA polymerase sigma-70 factor (ECF subfamily)